MYLYIDALYINQYIIINTKYKNNNNWYETFSPIPVVSVSWPSMFQASSRCRCRCDGTMFALFMSWPRPPSVYARLRWLSRASGGGAGSARLLRTLPGPHHWTLCFHLYHGNGDEVLLPHSFLLNGNSFMLTNGCDFSFVLFLFGFLFCFLWCFGQ